MTDIAFRFLWSSTNINCTLQLPFRSAYVNDEKNPSMVRWTADEWRVHLISVLSDKQSLDPARMAIVGRAPVAQSMELGEMSDEMFDMVKKALAVQHGVALYVSLAFTYLPSGSPGQHPLTRTAYIPAKTSSDTLRKWLDLNNAGAAPSVLAGLKRLLDEADPSSGVIRYARDLGYAPDGAKPAILATSFIYLESWTEPERTQLFRTIWPLETQVQSPLVIRVFSAPGADGVVEESFDLFTTTSEWAKCTYSSSKWEQVGALLLRSQENPAIISNREETKDGVPMGQVRVEGVSPAGMRALMSLLSLRFLLCVEVHFAISSPDPSTLQVGQYSMPKWCTVDEWRHVRERYAIQNIMASLGELLMPPHAVLKPLATMPAQAIRLKTVHLPFKDTQPHEITQFIHDPNPDTLVRFSNLLNPPETGFCVNVYTDVRMAIKRYAWSAPPSDTLFFEAKRTYDLRYFNRKVAQETIARLLESAPRASEAKAPITAEHTLDCAFVTQTHQLHFENIFRVAMGGCFPSVLRDPDFVAVYLYGQYCRFFAAPSGEGEGQVYDKPELDDPAHVYCYHLFTDIAITCYLSQYKDSRMDMVCIQLFRMLVWSAWHHFKHETKMDAPTAAGYINNITEALYNQFNAKMDELDKVTELQAPAATSASIVSKLKRLVFSPKAAAPAAPETTPHSWLRSAFMADLVALYQSFERGDASLVAKDPKNQCVLTYVDRPLS